MNSGRKNAVIPGVLFIVATAAALAAATVEPVLSGTDYLTKVAANASLVAGGAVFYLIAAFTSVGIAISLYPVLKTWNTGLALGSVVFRTMEAVLYIAAVVSLLSLVTLSQHFAHAGAADLPSLQAMGDSLRSMREHAYLAAVFAFSLGAFMYYYLFFQSRLIPRWLSGWGIAGTVLMLAACLMALFSDSYVTGYALLILPIAVQEIVLAVWLIVKGFNAPAIASRSANTGNERVLERGIA
ncbi:MAG TPA: DUF4386 domain-containing protein [Candidatus Dormibacteraeota bacterium]|nr:DUF4386 domain-containing protein [Candidatus Dormibacteraeota bacterium]